MPLTDMWEHCDRPAMIEPCPDDCGIETCHAVYCSKCLEQLAPYDCEETPAPVDYTRADICPDCLYTDANGWNEDHTGRPLPDPAPLSLLAGYLIGPDCDNLEDPDTLDAAYEPAFRWSPCEGCGSTLGGDRYTVRIVPAPKHATA